MKLAGYPPQNCAVDGAIAQIQERLERHALAPNEAVVRALGSYIGLLTKWNSRLNLTGFDLDPLSDEAIDRLIVEPILAADQAAGLRLQPGQSLKVVDIGSGGGSPAIPFSLALSNVDLAMVESKSRKAAFLREACRELGMKATVIENRAESLTRDPVGDDVDVVTIRAVRLDSRLSGVLTELLRPGGCVFWFRSGPKADPIDDHQASSPLFTARVVPLLPANRSELAILTASNRHS